MTAIEILLLVGLVVFITHSLEAITGFGCTVLAFPFVVMLMGDIESAKIVLSILAWVLALYFVVTKFRQIDWRQFGVIFLLAGLGLPIGIMVFNSLDRELLTRLLGAFIVLSASIQLYKCYFQSSGRVSLPRWMGYLFLFAGGIVHGAFAVGGPLIVLYSAKVITDKSRFRVTMCLLWTLLNAILIGQYLKDGCLTAAVGKDLLFLLPFLVAGIFVGEYIHNKVSELLFRKIIFFSLLVVGIVMVL